MTHPTHQRRQASIRGTTLVELLIGLSILMVLAALSTPGLSSLIRNHHLRSAADDVVFAVDMARGQAAANRRAYFVVFDGLTPGGSGLIFRVVQGLDTTCTAASLAGGMTVYATRDYSDGNALQNPRIDVTAFAPAQLATVGGACFKPDGRMLRADTGAYFSPPSSTSLGAGDIVLQLERTEGSGNHLGTALQVRIGYNGTARLTFGLPVDQLQ